LERSRLKAGASRNDPDAALIHQRSSTSQSVLQPAQKIGNSLFSQPLFGKCAGLRYGGMGADADRPHPPQK
jgi:hypothetical protein